MLHSVKDLHGSKLMAVDGAIGTAEDVYFDDEAWVARYLVADTGGWLSGRRVLIASRALDARGWRAGQLAVALTRDQIRDSPDIDTDKPISRQHEAEYHRYYGYPYYWGGMGMGPYPMGMGMGMYAMARPMPMPPQEAGDAHLRSVSAVTGYVIHALDGEIGHVGDFLVDDTDWAIRWMVIDTGHWLMGGRRVMVSPEWITAVSWDRGEVAVDLRRAVIEHSPEVDPAGPVDREYENRLYDYYDRPGYWH